ncbi:hypothetical protein DRE_05180 [Drechslerella stenobrocha 248]|uniref:Importin N-terminal domain-containing protein n=1 Tax=Drechslerella stenobrocha 248 TaxID=1043628 RepID=W7HR16_9PEZI|nr:hypothetical protein DRE_05180 [Drechslerella stenobrocha 248]
MVSPGVAEDNAAAPPPPRTMQEVEGLINTLYSPSTTPHDVQAINRVLQRLQRSPEGWLLATSLSSSANEHVQFFAASTWMVKLNTDWQGLSEQDALGLLDSLITWLIRVVSAGFKPFIWRKICVTLVNYYIRFSNLWQHCVRHLVCRFSGLTTGVQQDALHTLPPTETLLAQLSNVSKTVIVGFTRTLIEEVGRIDSKNSKGYHYHEGMNLNTPDAASVVMKVLTEPGSPLNHLTVEQVTLVEEALKCYQAWATYSTREAGQALQLFQPITRVTFEWLESPQIYRISSETVSEMLINSFYFYTAEDNHYLAERITGRWGQGKFSQVVPKEHDEYDSEETDAFAHMLVAFAESNLKGLVLTVESQTSQTIFEMLHGLLRLPGYPVADEEVSNLEFEFWSSLTEFMTDYPFEEGAPKPHWWGFCRSHLLRAVQEYWVKIRIPPQDVLADWYKDDKDGFQSYRKDFADLLETAYPVLQAELFGELVQHALNQVNAPLPDWQEVESCLFCINALSDTLTTEPTEYTFLSALFQSPLFSILANPESSELSRTKLTAISVIGSYSEYFEERTELLPGALNFLFSSLTIPKLINQASKSILSLCSSCRTKLTSELPAFIQHYQIFASRHPSESIGRERVLGALGCLVEALHREEDKASALEPLLTSVSADFIACKQLLSARYEEEAKERALLALRCLVSLGKSLQAPEEGPIIIDESDGVRKPRTIWDDGPGHQLQILLAQAIEDIAATFPKDREIAKEACDVFRCGFTETQPGLLVFPARFVVDFLLSCGARSPFYDVIIGTASAFVNCISAEGYGECRRLTGYVFGLIEGLDGNPETDPELAHNILEYANRLLTKHLHLFLEVQEAVLARVLALSLASLVCKEQFPKKTSCTFWTNLITTAAAVAAAGEGQGQRMMVEMILQQTGETLAKNLVMAIGGGAARSELDNVTEPLKKMVFKQLQARKWLEQGMFSNGEGFPSAKVTAEDKGMFLKKLFTLRGGRGTNQLVKEFWLACRGTEFSYAS